MVEITDQVALQECVGDKGRVLQKMKVGESFAVRAGEEKDVRWTAWNLFHRVDESTGLPLSEKRFTVKRDPLDQENFRCWRKK